MILHKGRWILLSKTALTLFACFSIATLLAQAIILGYLFLSWQLDREKVIEMLAIAQGIDLFAAEREALVQEEIPPEQPSYQDWIERRATMFRDLELRETALENAVDGLGVEQGQLTEAREAFRQVQEGFKVQLAAAKAEAAAEGMLTLGGILESIKPKQAKDQISEMLDNDEKDKVVVLFKGMSDSKRAKILAEFKTTEEIEQVAEILRLIGEGEPATSVPSETLQELEFASSPPR
ncbi:MAG: hypothetical protein ABIP48_07450 [Planctomycetota bacterium]